MKCRWEMPQRKERGHDWPSVRYRSHRTFRRAALPNLTNRQVGQWLPGLTAHPGPTRYGWQRPWLAPGGQNSAAPLLAPAQGPAWLPLANPGIVSIPLAFILGIVGTLSSPDRGGPARNAEMEVRSLTGIGAEKAVVTH